ncbi:unnamed protein product [Agarophyton chilense]
MTGKRKRKTSDQPSGSTQTPKRQKLQPRSSSTPKALQTLTNSKVNGLALSKTSKPSPRTKQSKNHVSVAVTKAVNEAKHLKECKGEARKDLYSSIVDLLTEALVKDVDSANLEMTPAEVSLSVRDEPIPVHEQCPVTLQSHKLHPQKRPKKTLSARQKSPSDVGKKGKIPKQVPSKAQKKKAGKETQASKSSKKAHPIAATKLKKSKPAPQSSRNSTKPEKRLAKKTASKSPVLKTPRTKLKQPPTETPVFIEELVVDEGAALVPEPCHSSEKKKKGKKRSVDGYDTEVVLDSSDHDANPTQQNPKDITLNLRPRLPWWRATESLASLSSNLGNREDLLKLYVMAVIRSCIRESWSADALKRCFENDPSSSRGKAFLAISSSLLVMERARHMGQCHVKWRPELMQELLQRRVIEWSRVQKHVSFDHFAGCDVCLGQREATIRLWLRGDRYDPSDFWPGSSRVEVLTSEEREKDVVSVAVELSGGTKNERFVQISEPAKKGDVEFWVDPQCLRKCLLFHELVHATAIIAQDLRILIEDELRDGVIHLDMRNRIPGDEKLGVSERLERYLVQAVSESRDFLKRRTKHLMEIISLGDIYFSAIEEELIDSGNPEGRRTPKTSQIYDPPIVLNDEKYKDRIDRIVSLTQQRGLTASFATFG